MGGLQIIKRTFIEECRGPGDEWLSKSCSYFIVIGERFGEKGNELDAYQQVCRKEISIGSRSDLDCFCWKGNLLLGSIFVYWSL